MLKPKRKRCSVCGELFSANTTFAKVCSARCKKTIATPEKVNKNVVSKREINAASKTHQVKLAQQAFNAYIRKRDDALPCISCGVHRTNFPYHAGHFISVGENYSLRFEELNVHKQCMYCNTHKHGNLHKYEINLIYKIGQDKVDWLKGNHNVKKYTIDEVKELAALYRRKLKEIS